MVLFPIRYDDRLVRLIRRRGVGIEVGEERERDVIACIDYNAVDVG